MKVSMFSKVLSFFYPLSFKKTSSDKHRELHVQLFCNQWMLSTREAVYSYGHFYTPFRRAFAKIKNELPGVHSFLLLGTGLGSALKILQKRYGLFPDAILVDNDKEVLDISMQFMELNEKKNVEWVYEDALSFLQRDSRRYDLLGVDLFRDMYIPSEFRKVSFFELCRQHLTENGYCIYNMIFNSSNEKELARERLQHVYSGVEEVTFRINTIFLCRR